MIEASPFYIVYSEFCECQISNNYLRNRLKIFFVRDCFVSPLTIAITVTIAITIGIVLGIRIIKYHTKVLKAFFFIHTV